MSLPLVQLAHPEHRQMSVGHSGNSDVELDNQCLGVFGVLATHVACAQLLIC